jgi:hypothetical protein
MPEGVDEYVGGPCFPRIAIHKDKIAHSNWNTEFLLGQVDLMLIYKEVLHNSQYWFDVVSSVIWWITIIMIWPSSCDCDSKIDADSAAAIKLNLYVPWIKTARLLSKAPCSTYCTKLGRQIQLKFSFNLKIIPLQILRCKEINTMSSI